MQIKLKFSYAKKYFLHYSEMEWVRDVIQYKYMEIGGGGVLADYYLKKVFIQ